MDNIIEKLRAELRSKLDSENYLKINREFYSELYFIVRVKLHSELRSELDWELRPEINSIIDG